MKPRLAWDETKRMRNLRKHGFDFANADWVLDSTLRLDVQTVRDTARGPELRVQSFSYVLNVLAVLTVVRAERDNKDRVISFRRASTEERQTYYEWLEQEDRE
jgi:uncharacterized DUF497 family protein